MSDPIVSICIPAYKKPEYVVRCLDSIRKQDYPQVEVVISDDSPNEDIKQALVPFLDSLNIRYFQNQPALGSPKNWNAALDKATGEYVLLMHQDDWFHSPVALTKFVEALKDPSIDFVFCQNTAIDELGKTVVLQGLPSLLKSMSDKPDHLVRAQVIGPPSNAMLRRTVPIRYDERFIWLVDVDYYSRLLKAGHRYRYLPQHLVSIGLHEDQTTVFCRTNPDIIFRENIWFAGKIGKEGVVDILLFDYFWRLLRNYHIRSTDDILKNGVRLDEIPKLILHQLNWQERISFRFLKVGLLSKIIMSCSYVAWKRIIRR